MAAARTFWWMHWPTVCRIELLRRPKMGFAIPLADWLRGPLRPMLRDHIESPQFFARNIVSPPFVRRMIAEHEAAAATIQPGSGRFWCSKCGSGKWNPPPGIPRTSRYLRSRRAMPESRIVSVDGIRGLAILLVVLSHLFGADGFPFQAGLASAALGNTGVRMFFVLSGFLITSLLMKEDARTGRIDLWRFYVRRSFRIFPAFYLYVAVAILFARAGGNSLARLSLMSAVFYFSDYVKWDHVDYTMRHFWSLAVEEQFYLLWPLVFTLARRHRRKILAAVILISPFWRYLIFHFSGWNLDAVIDRRFDAISDVLACGCLLALCEEQLGKISAYMLFLRSGRFYAVTGILLCGGLTLEHPRIYYLAGQTMLNCGLTALMDRAIRFPHAGYARVLNAWPLMSLGAISYSLYLWQQLFLNAERHGFWNHAIPAVCASLAAAILSYYTVEQPLLRYRNRRFRRFASGATIAA